MNEFCASETATRENITNTLNSKNEKDLIIIKKLEDLANNVLQKIRDKYNHPIIITSGYRCPNLNACVNGAKNSQHMKGEAADIKCNATTKKILWDLIVNMIKNEILEYGWDKKKK